MVPQIRKDLLHPGDIVNDRYRVIEKIDRGGAGTVYKVEQLGLGVHRALKILDPYQTDRIEEFERTFEAEVRNLSQLTHTNIVKILDYSTLSNNSEKPYRYFVMEYANRGLLVNTFQSLNSLKDLVDILRQLFDAFDYIHEHGLLHGDIKPKNILCHDSSGNTAIEVKVADLGVSKLFEVLKMDKSISSNITPDMTAIRGTRKYAAPEIRDMMTTGKTIDKNWLEANRRTLDLFSLGTSIAEMLSEKELAGEADDRRINELLGNLRPNILQLFSTLEEREYLERFVKKLTNHEPSERYESSARARSALLRLVPQHIAFSTISELTGVGCQYEIVHGEEVVSKLSEQFIKWVDHPVFSRLKNINQLGFMYQVYPGARHSRWEHCFEVFEVARETILHLLNDNRFRFLVDEIDISVFLAASLLHDIGHYPLAHLLEELRPSLSPVDDSNFLGVRKDYEMVKYFLEKEFGSAGSLRNLLEKDGIDPDRVVRLVAKGRIESDADAVLQSLLDGPFDIDKIAYLRHDSYAASISYGKGVDFDGLVTSLVVLLPEKHDVSSAQIGLRRRGISAAESVIVARYHMYDRVYWHRTNRAIMAMLNYAASHLIGPKESPYITFEEYINATHSLSDLEALSWLSAKMDSAIVEGAIIPASGRKVGNPLPNIMRESRLHYNKLITFSGGYDHLVTSHKFLMRLNRYQIDKLRAELLTIVSKHIGIEVDDNEVLIDIPATKKNLDASYKKELFVVDDRTGHVSSFWRMSAIADAAFRQYETIANSSRVFVSPRVFEAVKPNKDDLINEIVNTIQEYARK